MENIFYKGFEIKIFRSDSPESPDSWENEDTFLVYDHRDLEIERDGFAPRDIFNHFNNNPNKFTLYNGYFVFTVFAYIHGGISLSVNNTTYPSNDQWDVSTTGFVLVKRGKSSWTSDKALEYAKGLIETWNDYLSGNVYGYSSSVDSCSGYYGDDGKSDMIDEAKHEIDSAIRSLTAIHCQYLKRIIKSKVPICYRKPFTI